jgi:hypothetical protein
MTVQTVVDEAFVAVHRGTDYVLPDTPIPPVEVDRDD